MLGTCMGHFCCAEEKPKFRFSHVIQGYSTSTVNHLNMRLSGFTFHLSPFPTLLLTSLLLRFLLLDLASEPLPMSPLFSVFIVYTMTSILFISSLIHPL